METKGLHDVQPFFLVKKVRKSGAPRLMCFLDLVHLRVCDP